MEVNKNINVNTVSAKNNSWLRLTPNVVLTPIIEPVIISLDAYFKKAGVASMVTSGLRDANDQLRILRTYIRKSNLEKQFPELATCSVTDMVGVHYVWQMAWSTLLSKGIIISPPLAAKCLLHTTFDKRDRFGQLIPQTPHARGTAFDIGGGPDGIAIESKIVMDAWKVGKIPGLVNVLLEHNNNAIHCDCIKVK